MKDNKQRTRRKSGKDESRKINNICRHISARLLSWN